MFILDYTILHYAILYLSILQYTILDPHVYLAFGPLCLCGLCGPFNGQTPDPRLAPVDATSAAASAHGGGALAFLEGSYCA